MSKEDLRFDDVSSLIGSDWKKLAKQLNISQKEMKTIQSSYSNDKSQALAMLKFWVNKVGPEKSTENDLEKALKAIGREDIAFSCLSNVQQANQSLKEVIEKIGSDQPGFESVKDEFGHVQSRKEPPLGHQISLDVSYDEQDIMKVQK